MVSIAGYTNSGKSSLLNALTAGVAVQRDQLFSTLQTTTRRLSRQREEKRPSDLIFTDTVGFIRDLPPWLIDAFSSTLEEITESDAVVLVADASEGFDEMESKARTALEILRRIHAPRKMVTLLNKSDLIPLGRRQALMERFRLALLAPDVPVVFTSPRTGEGLQEVVGLLTTKVLEARYAIIRLDITRPGHLRLESWIRDRTDVLVEEEQGTLRTLQVRCPVGAWGILMGKAHEVEAPVEASSGSQGGAP